MKIVAPVDRSVFSESVVDLIIEIAAGRDYQVLLLNVAPREPDLLGRQLRRKVIDEPVPEELRDRRELLDRLAARLTESGARPETLLIRGDPAPTILREGERWHADLIVMGSHGRGMLYRRFIGSVSEAVLSARAFPVLVVPAPPGADAD